MMVQFYNPSTGEAEAGGWRVQVQPGLHSKTVSKKQKRRKGGKEERRGRKVPKCVSLGGGCCDRSFSSGIVPEGVLHGGGLVAMICVLIYPVPHINPFSPRARSEAICAVAREGPHLSKHG
jgi:hypothetical protein